MAHLYNPLDSYQSYSVHYVMVACRSTERARDFADAAKNKETLDAIERVKNLGDAISYGGSKDTAYLMMDTRRFSQFTIDTMKYGVLIQGLLEKSSHANFANDVNLTIVDSTGISFINFMQWLLDEQMQTNFDGMIMMLRTIFVGHKPDGSTETVQSISIPGQFHSIKLGLDDVRGTYECVFRPLVNFSTVAHARWLNIGVATDYFTGASNNTLGAMVASFEAELNKRSEAYYERVSSIVTQVRAPRPGSSKFGRKVRYQITLPEAWESFPFTGASTGAAIETDFVSILKKETEAKTTVQKKAAATTSTATSPITDSYLTVDAGLTITEVLDVMFRQTHKIAQLATDRDASKTDGLVTFHKHLIGITSDEETFTVHVNVIEFKIPNAVVTNQNKVGENEDRYYTTENGKRVPKNYFDLDYIFTGTNTQVLSFDMQMQDLAFMIVNNTRVGEGELFGVTANGQADTTAKPAADSDLIRARAYDPILIPLNTEAELTNFAQYAARQAAQQQSTLISDYQQYTRNLSAYYARSTFQASCTIKGNPLIMQKFNVGDLFKHPAAVEVSTSNSNSRDKAQYRADLNKRILADNNLLAQNADGSFTMMTGPSYLTSPVYVKMNIKGPNVDFRTGAPIPGQDYSTKILYDQYYWIQQVTNSIDKGVFTQEFLLYSAQLFNSNAATAGEKQVKEV